MLYTMPRLVFLCYFGSDRDLDYNNVSDSDDEVLDDSLLKWVLKEMGFSDTSFSKRRNEINGYISLKVLYKIKY